MRTVGTLFVLLPFLAGLPAHAADPAIKGKVQVAWQAEGLPLHIKMASRVEVQTPGIPGRPDQLLVLRLQARLDSPANGGWNKFLGLEINGRKVYQTMSGLRNAPQRVLNRDLQWVPPGYENDYMLFRDNQLCTVFAPDFTQYDRRLEHEGEEAFWYVLDVSDLVLPEAGNTITLANLAQPVWFGGQQHDIIVGDLSIGYLPASLRPAAAETRTRPLPKGKSLKGAGFSLILTPQGGLALQVGKEHYLLETSLTWPKGDLNWLACADRLAGEKKQGWKVTRAGLTAAGGCVVAEGASYRLTRGFRLDGPRVRMSDRIENLSGADLGVHLSYEMAAGGPLPTLYLGGDGTPTANFLDETAANPTVFAAQKGSGLGWVAEDDVLRVQLRLRNDRGAVSMYSPGLGIPRGGSYTVRWTLYPGRSTDYWAFINRLRRDWNVNFRIDGPFAFIGHCRDIAAQSVDELRRKLSPRKVRLAPMHPWTAYQYPYDREQHKGWWKEAQARIHQADPESKCLLMMEPPLESRVHKDQWEKDPYRDSMIFDRDGKPCFDMGYGPRYVGQKEFDAGWRLVWRYPTLTNSWGKFLEDDVKFAMEACRADGMYIDCFSYAFNRNWARRTNDRWDGHSVDLDPTTHEITAKYTDAALVSAPAQQRIVECIQARGGVVVANSEPATENMRRVRIFRFVETGSGPQYDRGTHLYTPVALGFPWYQLAPEMRTARSFIADVVANLEWGALYYYYGVPQTGYDYGVINRMFPFTPRELHSGWLVGEERIITSRSGEFGWGDKSRAKGYHYGSDGKETPLSLAPKLVAGKNVYPIRLGEGEVAILERVR